MKELLYKYSTKKVILFFVILGFVIFVLMQFFAVKIVDIKDEENKKVKTLNERLFYNIDEVYTELKSLPSESIENYKCVALLDSFFPIVFGFFMILFCAYCIKKITGTDSNWIYVALIPLIGIAFDYLENYHISQILENQETFTKDLLERTAFLTKMKFLFYFSPILILVVLAVSKKMRK